MLLQAGDKLPVVHRRLIVMDSLHFKSEESNHLADRWRAVQHESLRVDRQIGPLNYRNRSGMRVACTANSLVWPPHPPVRHTFSDTNQKTTVFRHAEQPNGSRCQPAEDIPAAKSVTCPPAPIT